MKNKNEEEENDMSVAEALEAIKDIPCDITVKTENAENSKPLRVLTGVTEGFVEIKRRF